jgi:DNA polymerase-3 subunit epsilon
VHLTFAAIDFETANRWPESACAVGVVRVEQGRIVQRRAWRIRPPTRWFEYTPIHGLSWLDVSHSLPFVCVWRDVASVIAGVDFLAAHYAEFDATVIDACCRRAAIPRPSVPFECTVALVRRTWDLPSARLDLVASHLGIPLHHHSPLSDAEACAEIVFRAYDTRDDGRHAIERGSVR